MLPRFTEALFTAAKAWNHPHAHTCPLTEEWIKMRYAHTMEYSSPAKKKEIRPFAATWTDLEIVIQSAVSQRRRNIIWHPLYVKSKRK